MADRSRLHELIDTLPDAAVPVAQGALEHYQTWPPPESPRIAELREEHRQRMRGSMRPGMGGGGGGGASYRMGPSGRVEYGHNSYSYWEDDSVVVVTHRFHAGHELVIEERLRLDGEAGRLFYAHEVIGPDGVREKREVGFRV